MTVPDRLSALDASFLALDTPTAPLHVGWTMRFAGSTPPLAQLRRHLDARLGSVPRFRRRVVRPVLGLGDARWADDPGFDVARHVHAVSVAPPGGLAELRDLAGVLLSTPLDLARPLWRVYLVDGLEGDGFALVGQAHHALVDGIAAIEVALLLFGPEAAAIDPAAAADAWRPEPVPAPAVTARAALAHRATGTLDAARGLQHALEQAGARGPAAVRDAPAALRDAAAALEALTRPGTPTSLERGVTARREIAFAQAGLDGVRAAGRRHGATVNDVLLAAATLALGRALHRRGEHPDAVKVLVPVNVREAGTAGALGNRISFLPVALPVAETDAVTILRRVRDATRAAKAAGSSGPLDALSRAADLLPGPAQRAFARTVMRAASYTAVVSNVPGPPIELSLLGRPLTAIFPAVPVPDGHALTIGCLSYGGRLHLGLAADAEVLPDLVDVARDLEAAFDVLRVEAPVAPTPWRAQARARRRPARAPSAART